MLAAALLLTAAGGQSVAERGVTAFALICLRNRQAGFDATRAALAASDAKRLEDLPPLGNSKPLELWVAGDLEFLLRSNGGRYGCFVAFKPVATDDAGMAVAALSNLPELVAKTVKPSRGVNYQWTLRDGSKDSVRLTPDSQLGGVLINLEVERK